MYYFIKAKDKDRKIGIILLKVFIFALITVESWGSGLGDGFINISPFALIIGLFANIGFPLLHPIIKEYKKDRDSIDSKLVTTCLVSIALNLVVAGFIKTFGIQLLCSIVVYFIYSDLLDRIYYQNKGYI